MKLITFVLSVVLFISCATSSLLIREAPSIDPNRTIKIVTKIEPEVLQPLKSLMLLMAEINHDPINIIINSPGGELESTYEFIQLMDDIKANDIEIHCYVPEMAASAAFAIFSHCSSRYALNGALMLWHKAKVDKLPPNLTDAEKEQVRQELIGVNAAMATDLINTLGQYMDHEVLIDIFQLQVAHEAMLLDRLAPGFMIVYPSIPGLMEMLPPKAIK